RVQAGEPGRRRGGAGGQADRDAGLAEQVHDLVQPGEVVAARLGLDARPGEDAERDGGDAGLAHEADVFRPHLARPLLGVVVGTEVDSVVLHSFTLPAVRPARQKRWSEAMVRTRRSADTAAPVTVSSKKAGSRKVCEFHRPRPSVTG